jgi:hypothetical protein
MLTMEPNWNYTATSPMDEGFWDAIEQTNRILSPKGLYITHLFAEDQVFLRPDWEQNIVPIESIKRILTSIVKSAGS